MLIQRPWRFLEMGEGHGHARRAAERRSSGEEVVEGGAERIEIAARVDGASLGLLRAHVEGSAERGAVLGELRAVGGCRQDPRQTEIGHLHFPGGGDQEVFRLDVAVNHPLPRRPIEGRADLRQHGESLAGVEWPALLQPGPERRAGDIFLGEEMVPVDAVDLVDLHDVAMHEPGGSPGFLREAKHGAGSGRRLLAEHLDGDGPRQRCLLREIDIRHRAAAEPSEQTVPPQTKAG